MIKRILILSICVSILLADRNFVLKDNPNGAEVAHKGVVGCEETSISKKQREDIQKIREDLGRILAKLSKMERGVKGRHATHKSHSKIERKRYKKSPTHIVVRVKRGDTLSSYARKYYGDKRKYYRIYRANRDKIGRDLKLKVGDRIVIPIGKNYRYKKFKKPKRGVVNRRVNRIEIRDRVIKRVKKPKMVGEQMEIVYTPHSMKKAKKVRNRDIEMLDKPVYIDDNGLDSSDFIPLDEN